MLSYFPEMEERQTKAECPLALIGGDQPVQGDAAVVLLRIAKLRPRGDAGWMVAEIALLGDYQDVSRMGSPGCRLFSTLCEALQGVLSDALEHGET
jgi:hypothetical protein